MAERTFFCGVDPPARMPKHSRVLQTFGSKQNIRLEPIAISRGLAEGIPDRMLDLLDIASYVFAADRLTARGGRVGHGMGPDWRRDLRFRIAVREPDHWSSPELVLALKDLLGFMSEDDYSFAFEKLDYPPQAQSYFNFGRDDTDAAPPAPVVLFSGGLDSLAGALQELNSSRDRVVLVTHRSSPIMTQCQNGLAAELSRRFPGRILYMSVQMTLTGGLNGSESSQRTRTFLFSAISGVVASMWGSPGIRFYENGIMSLNLPISPQVVGTAATRSTHPRTLREMSLFLSEALGRSCAVDNPFILKTKAEVLQVIADCGNSGLIASTISCTNIRRREAGKNHCGACAQCLHRRFGTLGAGLEQHDPASLYSLDLFTSERAVGSDRTMAIEFVRSARQFLQLNDGGFLSRFSGELSRVGSLPDLESDDTSVRALFELHRRHGKQVTLVLEDGIDEHKAALSQGTLPPGCLLSCIAGDQYGRRGPPEPEYAHHAPPSAVAGPDILLAIDQRRDEIIIAGLPPIKSKSGVQLLLLLAKQHRADSEDERAPKNFTFISSPRLEEQLGISNYALRRRVERIRDKIAEAFLDHAGQPVERELIIESIQWQGYRLNPRIRLVALAEMSGG
jgi:7-cyano-7-deazaguanine synthase in queuosine biosynthesis